MVKVRGLIIGWIDRAVDCAADPLVVPIHVIDVHDLQGPLTGCFTGRSSADADHGRTCMNICLVGTTGLISPTNRVAESQDPLHPVKGRVGVLVVQVRCQSDNRQSMPFA